ncbi:MAG: hypothetical protein ABSH49_13410 [Bryobacteraceae bacterium]|jgi:hypothetical protein
MANTVWFLVNYSLKPILLSQAHSTFAAYSTYRSFPAFDAPEVHHALGLGLLFIGVFVSVRVLLVRWWQKRSASNFHGIAIVNVSVYRRLAGALLICLPLGFVGYLRETNWNGSLSSLLLGQARFHILGQHQGLGYYMLLMMLGTIGYLLSAIAWALSGDHSRRRAQRQFVAGATVSLCVFWLFGERSAMICSMYIVAFAVMLRRAIYRVCLKKRRHKRVVLATAATLFLSVMFAGPLGVVLKNEGSDSARMAALALSPWDAYEITVFACANFGLGKTSGSSYLEDVVWTYVPRVFVPDKPTRYGIYGVPGREKAQIIDDYRNAAIGKMQRHLSEGAIVEEELDDLRKGFEIGHGHYPDSRAWVYLGGLASISTSPR